MANIYNLPGEEQSGVIWSMDHFPQRFQFVIFRNWNRIPVERIARVLGTTPEQIFCEAARLGLRKYDPAACAVWQERGYLTTIRENWFILNYKQLCELLDFSNDQLYRVLMDEDFMFHKMGNSKPNCPEVKWVELTDDELSATEEIGNFISLLTADEPAEKEFDFLQKLSAAPSEVKAFPVRIKARCGWFTVIVRRSVMCCCRVHLIPSRKGCLLNIRPAESMPYGSRCCCHRSRRGRGIWIIPKNGNCGWRLCRKWRKNLPDMTLNFSFI
jgi:hypothetical protein